MQAQPRFAGRLKREIAATSQVIVLTLFTRCQRECSLTVPDVRSKAVLENDHDRRTVITLWPRSNRAMRTPLIEHGCANKTGSSLSFMRKCRHRRSGDPENALPYPFRAQHELPALAVAKPWDRSAG